MTMICADDADDHDSGAQCPVRRRVPQKRRKSALGARSCANSMSQPPQITRPRESPPVAAVRWSRAAALDNTEPPASSLRDRQVISLLQLGLSNAAIAEELDISKRTVKAYVAKIAKRAGISGPPGSIRLAIATRYADPIFNPDTATGRRAWATLTPREREIATLVGRSGLSNRQVATCLGAGERTVTNHLCSVFDKVGV